MTKLLKLYKFFFFSFQNKKAQPKKLEMKEKSIGLFSANPGLGFMELNGGRAIFVYTVPNTW